MDSKVIALLGVTVAIAFGVIQVFDLGKPSTIIIEDKQFENLVQGGKNDDKTRVKKEDNPPKPDQVSRKEDWASNYISSTALVNSPQSQDYTILVTNGMNTVDFDVTAKIGEIYKKKGIKVIPTVLNSKFVSSGMFDKFYSGDFDSEAVNALSNHIDYLVLGRTDVQYANSGNFSDIEGMQNQITAQLNLSLKIFSVKSGQMVNSIHLSSNGIGASKTQSVDMAKERILEQVNKINIPG